MAGGDARRTAGGTLRSAQGWLPAQRLRSDM